LPAKVELCGRLPLGRMKEVRRLTQRLRFAADFHGVGRKRKSLSFASLTSGLIFSNAPESKLSSFRKNDFFSPLFVCFDLCDETLFQDKNGHVLTACPLLLKYWTRAIVLNEILHSLSKLMEELVAAKKLTPKKDGSEVYCLNDDLIRILAG